MATQPERLKARTKQFASFALCDFQNGKSSVNVPMARWLNDPMNPMAQWPDDPDGSWPDGPDDPILGWQF